ncbi:MAG: 30S ribosomal protein S8e [Conexivisphaerales archaeon]
MQKPMENLRKRKLTGGRRVPFRGRRNYEKDGYSTETVLGARKLGSRRVRGGKIKITAVSMDTVNVMDPTTHTSKKVKISRVLSNSANRDYERRGVMTKGAVIETEAGRARVTSRPSQDGVVNAVLIQK